MLNDQILFILFFALAYFLPVLFIVRDKRIKPAERAFWLLATFAVSWLAFLVFLWIAPLFGPHVEREKEGDLTQESLAAPASEKEKENGPVFETARKTLGVVAGVAAIVAFGFAVMVFMWVTRNFDGQNGMWFFAGIPLMAALVFMLPGAVFVGSMAIKAIAQFLK